jgi:rhodanese-related sulfurtransferase
MDTEISVFELQSHFAGETPTLIDVRSVPEFRTGHLSAAINIPLPELQSRRDDLRGESLVFICERGMRAHAARSAVLPCFPAARVLRGGMHAWRAAGLPLIQVTRTRWSLERQVRLIAGSLVLAGLLLGITVSPWLLLVAALPGAGLVFAGLTDLCPMAALLLRTPWNQMCNRPADAATSRQKEVNAN